MKHDISLNYRPEIQGLRALAVIVVVLSHADVPAFSGGFVGVDVFFVISGFLITGLLVKERHESGGISYIRFLTRRLKRLLPAMLVMLFSVAVAANSMLSGFEFAQRSASLPWAATWTSNLFFAFREIDYFTALQAHDLFLHTWSLGVEEQFYLLWPWLVMALMPAVAQAAGAARRRLVSGMLVVLIVSFSLSLMWSSDENRLAFYAMPSRAWQFALGSLVYILTARNSGSSLRTRLERLPPKASFWITSMGLVTILASTCFLRRGIVYPGFWAVLPSLGAALVLVGGEIRSSPASRNGISHPLMIWFGDRSYSLYLWHWPLLALAAVAGLPENPATLVAVLAAVVLIAALSYRYAELPFWKGARSRNSTPAILASSLVVIGLAMLAGQLMVQDAARRASQPLVTDGYDPRVDAPPIYTKGFRCDEGHLNDELEPCGIGSKEAEKTAVLLADSIGAQWVSALPSIFAPPTWQIVVLTKSACPIVDEDYIYERINRVYDVCRSWREKAIQHVNELKPDIVLVGSDASYPFSADQWIGGTARILGSIKEAAASIVIVAGTPGLSFDGPSCLQEPTRFAARLTGGRRPCEERLVADWPGQVVEYQQEASSAFENADVVSFNDLVCPDGFCAAQTIGGTVVYRDERHLTDSFVLEHAEEIRRRLFNLGLAEPTNR